MPILDPRKRREYRREWYKKNCKSEKAHVKRRKEVIRKWLNEYKSHVSCSICSESHPATIDFHHKSGKEFEVAYMVSNGYSIDRIKIELNKCQVLCANCHRKIHHLNKKL